LASALNAVVAGRLLAGDVTLTAKIGGTANSFNASMLIEQLNAAPVA